MPVTILGRRGNRPAGPLRHPGRVIAAGFASAITVGTLLLSVPFATASGNRAPLVDALFTATSAVCVTGLVTVDTGTYWSDYGRAVILLLIQLGGLGIMTVASLMAVIFSRRLGFHTRLIAQAETKALTAGDLRRLLGRIVIFTLVCEVTLAVILTVRFTVSYDQAATQGLYSGVFHAVSAFNNAGFSLYPDSMVRFGTDPWVTLPIAFGVIIGGLGFPVVFELLRAAHRPATWSVLTRITVTVTFALLLIGTLVMMLTEAGNPGTMGPLGPGEVLLASFFAAVMPRSGGFHTLDLAALRPETMFFTDALMFIGGGSAGTAGGIKVTTFGVLAYVLWSEMRGQRDVEVGRRKIPSTNQRQALAIALLGLGMVAIAAFLLLALAPPVGFDRVLFEAVSASATVGLSTGITADLPRSAHVVMVVLMFIGRIGPLTLASGLAFRDRPHLRELPEERTIVG